MNSIFLKRLKRKRILEGRVKCHLNKSSCISEHDCPKSKPIMSIIKKSWWNKFINWLKSLFITKTGEMNCP